MGEITFKITMEEFINKFPFSEFSEADLTTLFERLVIEINKKKQEKKLTVDLGFWDKEGNYKEDLQELSEEELKE